MRADAGELKRRIEAATPRDTVRGLVFNATFALVGEIAGAPAACAIDPGARARRHEFFSYPVADYLRVLWAAVPVLEPHLGPPDRVFWEIGRRFAMRWFASSLGRVLSVISGGDPRRALDHAPVAYRHMVSYGVCTVGWVSERHARIVIERDLLVPPFHGGSVSRALLDLGRVDAQVEARETGSLGTVLDATW